MIFGVVGFFVVVVVPSVFATLPVALEPLVMPVVLLVG
jgi:hypothetical protein